MKTQVEELLETGQDLIGQIEDTKEALESATEALASANSDIDNTVCDLSKQADELQRQIAAIRDLAPHASDPVTLATIEAINNLLALLQDAREYLQAGRALAALGTLQGFDHHADDLKAAIRLTLMAQRRQK